MADAPPPGFKEIAVPDGFKEVAPKPPVERGEGDKATSPTTPESIAGGIFTAGQPKPLDVLQRAGNAILPPLVTAPAVAMGGEALPAAPWVGRVLTSGGLGAAKSASQDKSAVKGGVTDVATSALVEGAMGALPKVKLPWVPSIADLAEKALRNPKVAFESIASRLPNARVLVPALDPSKKLTFTEIGERLAKLAGDKRKQAVEEIANILNGLDRQLLAGGPKPGAGTLFAERAGKAPVTGLQRFAESVVAPALKSPATRAAVDVEATPDVVEGIPRGAVPPIMALDALGGHGLAGMARHLLMR